jgi:hypothetical protein
MNGPSKRPRDNRGNFSAAVKEKMKSVLTDLLLTEVIVRGLDQDNLNSLANTAIQKGRLPSKKVYNLSRINTLRVIGDFRVP